MELVGGEALHVEDFREFGLLEAGVIFKGDETFCFVDEQVEAGGAADAVTFENFSMFHLFSVP